jgi:hypothetical protein
VDGKTIFNQILQKLLSFWLFKNQIYPLYLLINKKPFKKRIKKEKEEEEEEEEVETGGGSVGWGCC